jgi:hypothetical protein
MEARISARISTPGNEFKKKPKMVDSLRLDAVLEAVKLPARVTGLDTGLADVDGDNLTHCSRCRCRVTTALKTVR